MTLRDRVLYHQVHPLKLATDIGTTLLAVPLLWQHNLALGLAVALAPPVVASALLLRFADLRPIASSRLGSYLRRYMGARVQGVRAVGGIAVLVGASYQQPLVIGLSVVVIGLAWANGLARRAE